MITELQKKLLAVMLDSPEEKHYLYSLQKLTDGIVKKRSVAQILNTLVNNGYVYIEQEAVGKGARAPKKFYRLKEETKTLMEGYVLPPSVQPTPSLFDTPETETSESVSNEWV